MEIRISTTELKTALSRTQGVVADKKGTMPILSTVLLEATVTPEGGRLTVRAYDLEIGLCSQHGCEVKKEGSVAVPAKALFDIAKVLPESVARLKMGANNRIEITSGAASFRLAGMSAEDFPAMAQNTESGYERVERSAFKNALDKVLFAVSTDETRYNLNGVFVEATPDGVNLVATDGHRLALFEVKNDRRYGLKDRGVIVPRKAVNELRKLLGEDSEQPAELAFTENTMAYRRTGLTYTARLVDGQFPGYRQVVPEKSDAPLLIKRAALMETLRRVMLVSDHGSAVTFEVGDGKLVLTARAPDLGDATDSIAVDTGKLSLKLGLNGTLLLDMLSATDVETLALHITGDTDPVVVTPANSDAHLYVQMPMRM